MVNSIQSQGINQVIEQMRVLEAKSKGQALPQVHAEGDFSQALKGAIDAVNQAQQTSGQLKPAFENGNKNVSLAEVMVASQKSSVSFQAMIQIRNRAIQAYKDIMDMPV